MEPGNSTPKYNPRFRISPSCDKHYHLRMGMAEWKKEGGGNSLHTASHSVNEAIVAAEGTTDVGECTYSGYRL